ATVCKYLVPEGYPGSPHAGDVITLGPHSNALLYYANVDRQDGDLVTQTSRTLAFVGIGETLEHAEQAAEQAASEVKGRVRHRRDIGTRELLDRRIAHMKELQ
ncbi:MAG: phosphoribosylglycinamide synthetase C domain-containing protein, partial [Methanoregula sp.]